MLKGVIVRCPRRQTISTMHELIMTICMRNLLTEIKAAPQIFFEQIVLYSSVGIHTGNRNAILYSPAWTKKKTSARHTKENFFTLLSAFNVQNTIFNTILIRKKITL